MNWRTSEKCEELHELLQDVIHGQKMLKCSTSKLDGYRKQQQPKTVRQTARRWQVKWNWWEWGVPRTNKVMQTAYCSMTKYENKNIPASMESESKRTDWNTSAKQQMTDEWKLGKQVTNERKSEWTSGRQTKIGNRKLDRKTPLIITLYTLKYKQIKHACTCTGTNN